jgi:hypothetical protein
MGKPMANPKTRALLYSNTVPSKTYRELGGWVKKIKTSGEKMK